MEAVESRYAGTRQVNPMVVLEEEDGPLQAAGEQQEAVEQEEAGRGQEETGRGQEETTEDDPPEEL